MKQLGLKNRNQRGICARCGKPATGDHSDCKPPAKESAPVARKSKAPRKSSRGLYKGDYVPEYAK